MIKNYFKIAVRNLRKHKVYSLINILGLSVGMTITIFILLWVKDELSYDSYHSNAKNIFHVYKSVYTNNNDLWTQNTSAPLANDLKGNYPEIINTARLARTGELVLRYEDKYFIERKVVCVDPSYFDIFTLPFIYGNPESAMLNPHSIVLTEDIVKKYFGNENPIGKTIKINSKFDCQITGVIQNIPSNTNFKFDAFMPFLFLNNFGINLENYGASDVYTYVQLKNNINYELVSRKIFESFQSAVIQPNIVEKYYLIPLTEVRFFRNAHQVVVDVFSILAVIVLLIACINYINITTAQSSMHTSEVGVRKMFGAKLSDIRFQFLSETLLTSFVSLCLALILVEFALPAFNNLSGNNLQLIL